MGRRGRSAARRRLWDSITERFSGCGSEFPPRGSTNSNAPVLFRWPRRATTQFLYDGLNPVQEMNASNVATANLMTGLNIDEFFSRTDSSGARSFLMDILGSTLALTDSSGTIQTQYTYEPFGNVTISGVANGNSYQFTGRENDGTGLYFYRARYYSPTFQRFVRRNPIAEREGAPNLFGYVAEKA